MSDNHSQSKRPFDSERPFPWRCRHCGKIQVDMTTISYDAEVRHDGRVHEFTVHNLSLPVCEACGTKVFTENVDDQINSAPPYASPPANAGANGRSAKERVNMTQKEAAERLGIAEATLSRWLNEMQIQSRAMDNLLRVFFAFPPVRGALSGESQDPQLGATDILGPRRGRRSPRRKVTREREGSSLDAGK